ncbi:MAG: bifunctional methionine sulfoxide reductase B/A protein [Proteobacteria bacterium]|nr:bifunctional methionine sulfoxide reductase B/A protein [Pseudomonadota bacterium]
MAEKTKYNKLSDEEERVIIHKGTERPFTGEYNDFYEKGVYTCKQCGEDLFYSADKFSSGCGWPSFDDEVENAVIEIADADGMRTEILCSNCDAHLGHVFSGEGLTKKNRRHCVNSISLNFRAKEVQKQERAVVAGGCFWGVEYFFQRLEGVLATKVGYCGGRNSNPTYQEVCQGDTGHIEALEVIYDPDVVDYEKVLKLFFETHDPTQLDRQGPDIGPQYSSAIFYLDEDQEKTAKNLIKQLEEKGYTIATKLYPTNKFWPAEQYHQKYYQVKQQQPYCHAYVKRF